MGVSPCPVCGRSLDDRDRHYRFRLPEPVLRLPDQEATDGAWMWDDDPWTAVMMQVPGAGAFVRALLPVHLIGGGSITYGVWVEVDEADLHRAVEVWSSRRRYRRLRPVGRLASRVLPWDLLHAPVQLGVLHDDHPPYCTTSTDPGLVALLTQEQDPAPVLAAMGS